MAKRPWRARVDVAEGRVSGGLCGSRSSLLGREPTGLGRLRGAFPIVPAELELVSAADFLCHRTEVVSPLLAAIEVVQGAASPDERCGDEVHPSLVRFTGSRHRPQFGWSVL